ncbi:hypothetical protein [Streptomyces sp. NBC_01262]|uniref:hypothetical protein n=1 Tax=Streptomyces sp. NBC_01262 TaxID=2903803 RepID=UPI002E37872B|nr:hypothetical protein [Streptomyces sp. NBC_01262]
MSVMVSLVMVALFAVGLAVYLKFFSGESSSGSSNLKKSDISGVWISPKGARLEFQEDGRFAAKNISVAPECDPQGRRVSGERISGTGGWELGAFRDEGPGAVIDFEPVGGSVDRCSMWTVVEKADSAPQMYLLQDDGEGEIYSRAE